MREPNGMLAFKWINLLLFENTAILECFLRNDARRSDSSLFQVRRESILLDVMFCNRLFSSKHFFSEPCEFSTRLPAPHSSCR